MATRRGSSGHTTLVCLAAAVLGGGGAAPARAVIGVGGGDSRRDWSTCVAKSRKSALSCLHLRPLVGRATCGRLCEAMGGAGRYQRWPEPSGGELKAEYCGLACAHGPTRCTWILHRPPGGAFGMIRQPRRAPVGPYIPFPTSCHDSLPKSLISSSGLVR